jgi:hypothetical protein
MTEELKKNLKKLAEETEIKVARSVLRWKYNKEGRQIPPEHQLDNDSKRVAFKAHHVIAKRGKSVWNELKAVYFKGGRKKGGRDE